MKQILLFRNLIESLPKNAGLYQVGVLTLLFYKQSFEIITLVLGLFAFLVVYSSVYVFNDLVDVEDDKQNYETLDRKPIAQGIVQIRDAAKIGVLLLLIGLILSVFVNLFFLGIICSLLILNGIYSYPIKRKKTVAHARIESERDLSQNVSGDSFLKMKSTPLGLPLIFSIQFLKILLPWTITPSVTDFPFLLAAGLSLIYMIMFSGYKKKKTVGESIRENWLLALLTISMFIGSLLVHSEVYLQSVLLGFILGGVVGFWRLQFTSKKFIALGNVYLVIAISIILLVYLVNSGY